MHPVMRRVPAERAIHVKRLGHAQGAQGPAVDGNNATTLSQDATSATSASSQTSAATPSTSQFPSSALPTSSATHSSVTTSSTPSSHPVTTSTDTQSPTPTALSSLPTTLAQPTTSTLSTYPASTSSPPTDAAAATSRGLSGGAIAGIIAGGIIVGVALIVFFVRKTYLRRRERKHISWNGAPDMGAGIPDEPKFPDISDGLASLTSLPNTPHRGAPPPLSPFEAHGRPIHSASVLPPARMQAPAMSSYLVPTPPPATYNNPIPVSPYPTQPIPPTYGPANTAVFTMGRVPSVHGHHVPPEAAVKFTFVPTLPDELSITTGERLFVLEEYDDGWDLCANGRGERGMVPRECLEHPPSDQPGIGWRNMRRISSLNPDGFGF